MKTMILTLAMILPMSAMAKVADFNALIRDNTAVQKELHQEVRNGVHASRNALAPRERMVVVETGSDTMNVPTNKKMLRFSKEMVNHKAESKDMDQRLANEFNSADFEL